MNKERESVRFSSWPVSVPNDGAAPSWPINEVQLQILEAQGLSDEEIAARFQVDWRHVVALRNALL